MTICRTDLSKSLEQELKDIYIKEQDAKVIEEAKKKYVKFKKSKSQKRKKSKSKSKSQKRKKSQSRSRKL